MVNVDISNIWCSVTLPMLLESEQQISAAHAALMDGEAAAFLPWLDGDNSAVLEQVEEAAKAIRAQAGVLVVVGSDSAVAGVRAVVELLRGRDHNLRPGTQIVFAGSDLSTRSWQHLAELLEKIHPQDLVKFGLIPEFVGRIPIITHVDDLDEPDLVRILTEPKNALVRQYQKLFELEQVQLRFTADALKAIAARAIERKTGARGLRNVMERTMLDIMYKLPSMPNVRECLINQAVIEKGKDPVLLYDDGTEVKPEEQAS